MKVLVMSDTHGMMSEVYNHIESMEFDSIIHLGDYVRDAEELKMVYGDIVHYIAGNNDFGSNAPYHMVFELNGKKILATHGHLEGVKSGFENLYELAVGNGIDIVFYGHTHIASDVVKDGIRFINPGSPKLPSGGQTGSMGVLNSDDMSFEYIYFD